MARRNTLRLYITADGRVAVKTFDEVGQASTRSAEKVEEGGKRSQHSMALVEESSHRLRGAVMSLAGTVGLAGLGFGIADVIKAGQDWQLQQSRLQQSLKATGLLSKRTMDQLNRSAETTAVHGGFAAPEQIGALAQFVRLTGSATEAVKSNRAAMELARGSGLDYTRAQRMIGQALTGNVGRLQRYLGIIMPVKTAEFALTQGHQFNIFQMEAQSRALGKLGPLWLKQQEILHNLTPAMVQHAQLLDRQATAQKVLGVIQRKYGGSMAAFSRTTAGAISNAKNAIDLAIERLGSKALPVVAKIAGGIASFVTYLSNHKDVLVTFGAALGGIGVAFAFTKFVEGFQAMRLAVIAFAGAEEGATLATVTWGMALRLTIIGIAITALYLLVTHFKQVKAVAIDVAKWIVGAWHSVEAFFIRLWHTIERVGKAIGRIATAPSRLFGSIGHGIGHFFGSLFGAQGGLVGTLPVRHMAWGGPVGGFGTGDRVPLLADPREFVLRPQAVQSIGVPTLNAINTYGAAALNRNAPDEVYVVAPIRVQAGARILAETTVHAAARKSALAGGYVSG